MEWRRAELEQRVRTAWGPDTCYSEELWDPALPETGQCGTTALVVAELLGGELLEAPVFRGDERVEFHYWTRLESGEEIDWTREQFQDDRVVGEPVVKARPDRLKEPFQTMYETLLRRVAEGSAGS